MNEITIKRHSFDLAKKRLKDFSEKTESELEIERVRTDGGFLGLGDHKVTGYELNGRLETIQDHFISVNKTNNKVIKEFGEVYKALDALDKDYISSIIANVKAIEKTSNDVRIQQGTLKQHHEKLASQQSKLDAHQTEIEKNVANISKIVTALKVFKEKLERYKHLEDIDKIWTDCQKWHKEISSLTGSLATAASTSNENTKTISGVKRSLKATDDKVTHLSNCVTEQIARLENVISFMDGLKKVTHLKDIDDMWGSLSNAHTALSNLCDELNAAKEVAVRQQQEIDQALAFVDTASRYEHLKDVDAMWDSLADAHGSLKDLRSELDAAREVAVRQQQEIDQALAFVDTASRYEHLKDVDAMWDKVEDHGHRLDTLTEHGKNTDAAVQKNRDAIAALTDYRQELSSIVHLKDVDSLWEASEKHSCQIEELQNQGEETRTLIAQNKELADQSLATEKEKTDTALQQLNKKMKYSYWIAGGALALALVELLIILLR